MEIGIDCIEINRFCEIKANERLLRRIFTKEEVEYCRGKSYPPQHLAARFAAKEAIIKALSNFSARVPLNGIAISKDTRGVPCAKFLDAGLNRRYKIKISMSHSDSVAVACALVTKVGSNRRRKNKNDV